MIGFLAPMYMALVITTLYYILGYNPMLSHERKGHASDASDFKPNPVDLFLFQLFRLGQSQIATTAPANNGGQAAPTGSSHDGAPTASIASHSDEQLREDGQIAKAFGAVNTI